MSNTHLPVGVDPALHAEEVEQVEGVLDGRPHVGQAPGLQVLQLRRERPRRLLPPRLQTAKVNVKVKVRP